MAKDFDDSLKPIRGHDLEKLLTFAEKEELPKSKYIDWDMVTDWNNEHKYRPVGDLDKAAVRLRIEETQKLLEGLEGAVIVDKLRQWAKSIEDDKDIFTPLAVYLQVRLLEAPTYELLIFGRFFDAPGVLNEAAKKRIDDQLGAYVNPEDFCRIEVVRALAPIDAEHCQSLVRLCAQKGIGRVRGGGVFQAVEMRNLKGEPVPDFWVLYFNGPALDPSFHVPMKKVVGRLEIR